MSIRSTVKAIIFKDGKVLLNRCRDAEFGDYFSFPGGGQHQYETLHEAVKRECLEETGYSATSIKFAALCETIFTNEDFRKRAPDYAHRVFHVFLCEACAAEAAPSEMDSTQTGSEWVDIEAIKNLRVFPKAVGENIKELISGTAPVFLGSEYKD